MPQADNAFLNLAGEFAVASELNRRRVLASVTYGSSKCADVFAISPDMTQVVRIEVKATNAKRKTRWLIGEKGTKSDVATEVFWVFVLFPALPDCEAEDDAQRGAYAPRFFILSQKEVYEAWKKESDDYNNRRRDRGLRSFEGLGVPGVRLEDIKSQECQWHKITSRLQTPEVLLEPHRSKTQSQAVSH